MITIPKLWISVEKSNRIIEEILTLASKTSPSTSQAVTDVNKAKKWSLNKKLTVWGKLVPPAGCGGTLRYTTIRCHIKTDKDKNIFTDSERPSNPSS